MLTLALDECGVCQSPALQEEVSVFPLYLVYTLWTGTLPLCSYPDPCQTFCVLCICIGLDFMMKYYRLDDWNNGNSFVTVLEAGSSRIRMLAVWFPAEGLHPGWQISALFSFLKWQCWGWWGERMLVDAFPCNGTDSIGRVLPICLDLNLMITQRFHFHISKFQMRSPT